MNQTVDCPQLHATLRGGQTPEGPEVQAHLAECPACAELLKEGGDLGAALAELEFPPAELTATYQALAGQLEQERGPVAWLRSRRSAQRVTVALVTLVVVVLVGGTVHPRADFGLYPALRMALTLLVYAGLLVLAARAALRPLQDAPKASDIGVLIGALIAPFALSLGPAAHIDHPASVMGMGSDFAGRAASCFVHGAALAAFSVLLLWSLERGAHRGMKAAALAALLGGIVGNAALQLHCPITHPEHLVVGHAAISIVILCGYVGVRRLAFNRHA